jgi:hypothetical protein
MIRARLRAADRLLEIGPPREAFASLSSLAEEFDDDDAGGREKVLDVRLFLVSLRRARPSSAESSGVELLSLLWRRDFSARLGLCRPSPSPEVPCTLELRCPLPSMPLLWELEERFSRRDPRLGERLRWRSFPNKPSSSALSSENDSSSSSSSWASEACFDCFVLLRRFCV